MHLTGKFEILTKLWLFGLLLGLSACGSGDSDSSPVNGNRDGKAGSMARFALVGDYLYTISGKDMQLFDVTVPSMPTVFAKVTIDRGIETLFPYGDYLFVGASDGVYIYDNTSKGSNPVFVSKFRHVTACDPVVVSGQYAYVTLSSEGALCGQGLNQMEVLDISDVTNPELVTTIAMQNPKGLGVESGLLFVCDGAAGLKIFNLADPANPGQPPSTDTSIDCYDLIPNQNSLVISDAGGILQYNYNDFERVSEINIEVE